MTDKLKTTADRIVKVVIANLSAEGIDRQTLHEFIGKDIRRRPKRKFKCCLKLKRNTARRRTAWRTRAKFWALRPTSRPFECGGLVMARLPILKKRRFSASHMNRLFAESRRRMRISRSHVPHNLRSSAKYNAG